MNKYIVLRYNKDAKIKLQFFAKNRRFGLYPQNDGEWSIYLFKTRQEASNVIDKIKRGSGKILIENIYD